MKKIKKSTKPSEFNPELSCEGFLIQAAAGQSRDQLMPQVQTALPGIWKVLPIGSQGSDFLLKPADGGLVNTALCWDWAGRLAALPGVAEAEPALASEIRAPKPVKLKTGAKSGGGDAVLPCAKSNELWSLEMMHVPEAWALNPPTGGKRFGQGIRVGHPDTGYRPHPELTASGQLRADLGYNFEEENTNATDLLESGNPGHGTATGSVIMSPRGVQLEGATRGVSGVAPRAELVPFRVSNRVVHLSMANLTRAIHASIDTGCHVVSMSLGGLLAPAALERAIDAAAERGVILLAAAGNQVPWVVSPARLPGVLAVAACNCQKKPWSGSSRGSEVDVTAPGESVWRASVSEDGGFGIGPGSGTSYAVASAAGACALWLAFHGRDRLLNKYGPRGLVRVFERMLAATVETPSGWDNSKYGRGIVNARALLERALPATAPSAVESKALAQKHAAEAVLDRVAALFPGVAAGKVCQAVAASFGVSAEAVPTFASEIAFHLLTSPKLHEEVRRNLEGGTLKTAAKNAVKKSPADVLKRHPALAAAASSRLREEMLVGQSNATKAPSGKTSAKTKSAAAAAVATTGQVDKVIITAAATLKKKYGGTGLKKVQTALGKLIAADLKRGVVSRVFDLQDKALLKTLGLPASAAPLTEQAAKNAVDAIFAAHRPAYVLLLGAPDVIPYISLDNPIDDDDPVVPSDLPYACDQPFSTDPLVFRAPTRVVGRLPDINGARKPDALLAALKEAAAWQSDAAASYSGEFFGLSTASWQKSTRKNLQSLFGKKAQPLLSPPAGPDWTKTELAPRSHFINCHGAMSSPEFYGEEDKEEDPEQPVSHESDHLKTRVVRGTIIAAECCYGAELYNPVIDPDAPELTVAPSIANRYLEQGAWAFVGSTTVAYGPAVGLGEADLICQFFFKHIFAGFSTGRAFLQARLDFVKAARRISPTEMKTLAQFVLLGDPSIHPVVKQAAKAAAKKLSTATPAEKHAKAVSLSQGREQRRSLLRQESRGLREKTGRFSKEGGNVSDSMRQKMLSSAGMTKKASFRLKSSSFVNTIRSGWAVSAPLTKSAKSAKGADVLAKARRLGSTDSPTEGEVRFHVLIGEPATPGGGKAHAGDRPKRPSRFLRNGVLLIACEEGGKMTVKKLYPH